MSAYSLESALLFETPEEMWARVYRQIRPRSPVPSFSITFCPFANANSFIRVEGGAIHVRISDILQDAPAPVLESLAFILLSKLYRKPVPRAYAHRYRLYLNRHDVRSEIHEVRRARGRKYVSGPKGSHYDLAEVFESVNFRYFGGLMAMPDLGWSRQSARSTLGHYDPVHHAIVISSALDRAEVPRLALEYVMFHEMLHVRYPVEHRGARRRVHTKEFREAEKQFPQLAEAKALLRTL